MSFITITTNGEFGNTHQTFNTDGIGHARALELALAHIYKMVPKAKEADEWLDVPAFLRRNPNDV